MSAVFILRKSTPNNLKAKWLCRSSLGLSLQNEGRTLQCLRSYIWNRAQKHDDFLRSQLYCSDL